MNNLLKMLLILTGFVCNATAYIVDAIEIQTNSSDPDIIDGAGRVVRPSRGVFGLSGFIDIKQDIDTDITTFEVKIFYSPTGITYTLSPFRIPVQPVTQSLNHVYKDYMMNAMLECCTNALEIEEPFVSPLTKRLVNCENCIFPSDNFPSSLRPGYYRLLLLTRKPTIAISILLKVELD